jgi:pyruvate formate lyase activating enzyme
MQEARFWEKKESKKVKCLNCSHYCLINDGNFGICNVRQNIKGKLFSLNYGLICAIGLDPIEKKPLFHFLPGTRTFSFAAPGCNFSCKNCQNWQISQGPKILKMVTGEFLAPKDIVKKTIESNCPSISYTYTEPTIFSEYAIDTMKIAKKQGLKNIWISNGYFSKELFKEIYPLLDAVNIDLKSFDDKFYQENCSGKVWPILENLRALKKKNVWIEITTLLIPGLNDGKQELTDIAKFIRTELGQDTPWHITRFFGQYSWKLRNILDTSLENLIQARKIGLDQGLHHVYLGNVPGVDSEDTYCPRCQELIIDRNGFDVKRYDKEGKCPKCLNKIEGLFI